MINSWRKSKVYTNGDGLILVINSWQKSKVYTNGDDLERCSRSNPSLTKGRSFRDAIFGSIFELQQREELKRSGRRKIIYSMFFYLFRYRRNIEHLTCEVRDGNELEDEVWEYAIEALRRGNDENYNKARKWMKNVYEKLYEAKITLEDAGKGENAGYINWRRLNIISRHRLSRKAYKMAQDIAKSLDSDEARSFQVVDIPSTKVVATKAILKALEDKKVRKIGLYGIASGRMMAILMNAGIKAYKRKVFDKVIWVSMPQNPNLVLIQREIAKRLDSDLQLNINNSEDLEENAKLLNESLIKATNTLVIFADVHQHFSLHEIGIRDGGNWKIVITSREERMCNEMGSQKNIDMQKHISKTWSKFNDKKEWQEKGGIDSIVKELIEDCEALSYGPGKEIDLMRLSKGINELLIRQRKEITPCIVKEVKKKIEKIIQPTAADPDRRKAK